MDPKVAQYLIQKGLVSDPNQSPADNFVNGLGQTPTPPSPNLQDVPQDMPQDIPQAAPAARSIASVPKVAPVEDDDKYGVLDPDELKRYGIKTPEEIEAMKNARLKMGDDLVAQGNGNAMAKLFAQASDNINSTGNRIIAGNTSNTAKGIGEALDQNQKDQGAKITAFDDAQKVGDPSYNRLESIDDKRLKLQQLRDSAKDRAAALKIAAQTRQDNHQSMEDRKDDDQLARFSKSLNGATASSRNALGRSATTIQAARSVMALAGDDPSQYNKLNPQQVYEIAKGYDRVVSNGNPTVSGTKSLIPPAALSSLANFNQWWSGNVNGAGQGQIVNQMVQGAKREAAVSQNLQRHMVDSLLPAYANLRKRRGDDMDQIVNGINGQQSDNIPQILDDAKVPHFGGGGQQAMPFQIDHNALDAELKRRQQGQQ